MSLVRRRRVGGGLGEAGPEEIARAIRERTELARTDLALEDQRSSISRWVPQNITGGFCLTVRPKRVMNVITKTKRALQRRAQRKVNDYVLIRNFRRVRPGLAWCRTRRNQTPTVPPWTAHVRTPAPTAAP